MLLARPLRSNDAVAAQSRGTRSLEARVKGDHSSIDSVLEQLKIRHGRAPQTAEERTMHYSKFDVLLGRGRAFQLYPGNRRFHDLISAHAERYAQANVQSGKWSITMDIVEAIVKVGRFLKPVSEHDDRLGWTLIPLDVARQKVAHALQYQLRRVSQQARRSKAQRQRIDSQDTEPPHSTVVEARDVGESSSVVQDTNMDQNRSTNVVADKPLFDVPIMAPIIHSPPIAPNETVVPSFDALLEVDLDPSADTFLSDECWTLLESLETESAFDDNVRDTFPLKVSMTDTGTADLNLYDILERAGWPVLVPDGRGGPNDASLEPLARPLAPVALESTPTMTLAKAHHGKRLFDVNATGLPLDDPNNGSVSSLDLFECLLD